MDTAISVKNLSKSYRMYPSPAERLKEMLHPFGKKYHRDFWALRDISFEVKKGECIGIIGRNGSGKSTLLQLLCGVLPPTEGEVKVNGRISALLELGAGFNPEFSGRENVYMNGALMGFTKEEMDDRFDAIAGFADIGDFIEQPVRTYSSGMYVRLAFACAVNVDPDILIVDEALAVGDIRFQQRCYAKFESFRESGKTILFVSHSLDSIKMYCSRAALLDGGRVIEEGQPKEVVNKYLKIMRKMDDDSLEDKKAKAKVEAEAAFSLGEAGPNQLYPIEESIWYNKNEYKYGTGEVVFTKIGLFDESGNASQDFEVGGCIGVLLSRI